MKLNELKIPRGMVKKARKRRGKGPGTGQGGTSGRGHKGQNARAGGGVRRSFEGGQMPLIRRVPKQGFFNPFSTKYEVVNLSDIAKKELAGEITPEVLRKAGLIKGREPKIKILGDGEPVGAMTIKAHKFSASAREKIEKAGGTAEEL